MMRRLLFAALVLAAVAAAEAEYTLPPDKLAKAVEYSAAKDRLYFAGFACSVLVLGAVLAGGVAPRFRDWAEAVSRRRIAQAYVFSALLVVTLDVADLPLAVYRHHLAVRYSQSIQGWASWLWDWAKTELLTIALAGALVWLLYAVMRRSPRRWWFYGWLASLPITVFLVFLAPLAIDPLFYKYTPLAARHPALVTELEKVTARGGLRIPPSRMFEMHAGEKWNSLNAYVTGLGASKRVVVWDTTIARMTTPQIMFVFGHEMGHYVLGHMWLGMGATAIGLLVVLFASYHAMHAALRRWGARCRVRSIDDWASLPLLVLTGAILGFLAEPVSNGYSRVLEHHADIYGLEVVHSLAPRAAAMDSFQISGEVALDHPNPSPFIEFWRYSHPSTTRRMRFAGQYDPWTTGAPRKYIP